MKNFILFIVFTFCLIFTSVIKNKTRSLEKKIVKLDIEIKDLNSELIDLQLDYAYLSSPDILQKLSKKYFDDTTFIHYQKKDINNFNTGKIKKIYFSFLEKKN